MAITLDELELPDQLDWKDEFSWAPVVQQKTYTISGAMIVEENSAPEGRTITLVGDGGVWVRRGLVKAIKAKEAQVSTPMTLVLHDGRRFSVLWNREAGGAVQARSFASVILTTTPSTTPISDLSYLRNR